MDSDKEQRIQELREQLAELESEAVESAEEAAEEGTETVHESVAESAEQAQEAAEELVEQIEEEAHEAANGDPDVEERIFHRIMDRLHEDGVHVHETTEAVADHTPEVAEELAAEPVATVEEVTHVATPDVAPEPEHWWYRRRNIFGRVV